MTEILIDLKAEQETLDRFLGTLSEPQWDLPSPAEGWTVKDSVAHIAHIDEVAVSLLGGDYTPLEEAARVKLGFTEIGPQKGATPSKESPGLPCPWEPAPLPPQGSWRPGLMASIVLMPRGLSPRIRTVSGMLLFSLIWLGPMLIR
jgi:hypothetical protein